AAGPGFVLGGGRRPAAGAGRRFNSRPCRSGWGSPRVGSIPNGWARARFRGTMQWHRLVARGGILLRPLGLVLVRYVLGLALLRVPGCEVRRVAGPKHPRFPELVDEYRKTFAQVLGGLFLLVGLYLTWRRLAVAERQVAALQEGQVTERFTRAIDQL